MNGKGCIMRKQAMVLSLLVLVGVGPAWGQIRLRHKVELGTAASFQSRHEEGYDSTWLNIPVRLGYFITNWLEAEPEMILSKTDYIDDYPNTWSYLLNLNMAAHVRLAERAYPFLLAGAGVGNGIPAWGIVYGDSGYRAGVLNFGAGIKFFPAAFVAIRAEYRFSRFKLTYPVYPDTREMVKGRMDQIFVGVSVLF
jgi:opacity protein-like surface antigen